jgi:hypothetical protein
VSRYSSLLRVEESQARISQFDSKLAKARGWVGHV